MSIEPLLAAQLLLLGCCTGFLAGLLGIGGGMLLVPFLTFLLSRHGVPDGLAVKMAIATSMSTILFTSLSSVRAHHRRGAVRWGIVRDMAPGIVVGGLLAFAGSAADGAGGRRVVRGAGGLLAGGVWVTMGGVLLQSANGFRQIVDTAGRDVRHLMGAVRQLATAFLVQAVGFCLQLVLVGVGLAVAG